MEGRRACRLNIVVEVDTHNTVITSQFDSNNKFHFYTTKTAKLLLYYLRARELGESRAGDVRQAAHEQD